MLQAFSARVVGISPIEVVAAGANESSPPKRRSGEHVPKDALVLAYRRKRAFLEDRAAG